MRGVTSGASVSSCSSASTAIPLFCLKRVGARPRTTSYGTMRLSASLRARPYLADASI